MRAIAASKIPTVSAVGHEIDVTLADLVADVRALTPSEAAERVVPSADEVATQIRGYHRRLGRGAGHYASLGRSRLESITSTRPFRRPFELVQDLSRRLDDISERANRTVRGSIRDRLGLLQTLGGKLESLSPLDVLERGYSITHDSKTGRVIRSAANLKIGQKIATRFAKGQVTSTIKDVSNDT